MQTARTVLNAATNAALKAKPEPTRIRARKLDALVAKRDDAVPRDPE